MSETNASNTYHRNNTTTTAITSLTSSSKAQKQVVNYRPASIATLSTVDVTTSSASTNNNNKNNNVDKSSVTSVSMPYQIHLLLLPTNDELDGQTIMEYIYDVLLDGFHLMDDIVIVEYDAPATMNTRHQQQQQQQQHRQQQRCVSITYEHEWRCQIHFNDNARQVLRDSQRWSRRYGTDLPIDVQDIIASCTRRLDITSDPDPQRDYFDDFYALLDHLRNTLGPCFIFDPIQNEFLL